MEFSFLYPGVLLSLGILIYSNESIAADTTTSPAEVQIGVLAFNGAQRALSRWQPTADYLSREIPSRRFKVIPLTHEGFSNAINKGQLDFILTNPGHYVRLEVSFGTTRIATFKSRFNDRQLTHFSSVIFTQSGSEIKELSQLSGRRMAAVSKDAFGGFQLAQKVLQDHGINAISDMSMLWLGFPQSDIVTAVLEERADVGTVRSGVIEKLVDQGTINRKAIRVLGEKTSDNFPFMHSTELFPEWPFARLPHTDEDLAKQVAITLLEMPGNSMPSIASEGAGWTIPLDYTVVHNIFRSLQLEPYAPVPVEFKDFWKSYRQWVFLLGLLFVVTLLAILFILKINRQLKSTQQDLFEHQEQLEQTIEQRTAELIETNQALQQDIHSRIQFEETLHGGCETLQSLYTISIRYDLTREQRLQSMVDLGRQYFSAEKASLSRFDGKQFITCTTSPANESIQAPLSEALALEAIEEGQVVTHSQKDINQSYLACPVQISGQLHYLFEFFISNDSPAEYLESNDALSSELSLRILHLLSLWVGNEMTLIDNEMKAENRYQEAQQRLAEVTPRELEILKLVAEGESNKSIARLLDISPKTVELHRSNLLRKTELNSSTQLVKLAVLSGVSS